MINNNWDLVLEKQYEKPYFKNLSKFIKDEYINKTIYPKYSEIFNSLKYTDYDSVKVVILGQDPYHGENEANGLSFSVKKEVKTPPSLRNIFKELQNDLNIERKNPDLIDWAKQGVLLLNSIMTVIKDCPLSHKNKGWEIFTDIIIKELNDKKTPVVFILWGNYAKSKKNLITNKRHFIIESPHPSPFSANRGFFGSRPFSRTNDFLQKNNLEKINW
ncbi:MAG: uracil-DNA glycosylase [Bacilli bacterium]|nr:uracil-DNA glycosylase [Bacilli bacterium]